MTTPATKHVSPTPSPWLVGEGGQHVYYINPRIEAGEDLEDPSHDSIVAECGNMGAFSGIPDEQREANARLIAAAPDLYDALQRLADFAALPREEQDHLETVANESTAGNVSHLEVLLDAAYTALSKARGNA